MKKIPIKKVTIKYAAEFFGFGKVGKLYYDPMYLIFWEPTEGPLGVAQAYIGDGDYADKKGYTGKEMVQMFYDYWKDAGEEPYMEVEDEDE